MCGNGVFDIYIYRVRWVLGRWRVIYILVLAAWFTARGRYRVPGRDSSTSSYSRQAGAPFPSFPFLSLLDHHGACNESLPYLTLPYLTLPCL